MTYQEIVHKVSEDTGISVEVVDCLLKDMRKNLLNKAYKEFDFK